MARPTKTTVNSEDQAWDAAINDNMTALWDGPLPVVQDTSPYPSASSYDDCIIVDSSDHHLRISDGTNWHIIPIQAEAIEDINDGSGGTVVTPAEIYTVSDIASAADAIAVLAAKMNEILYELRQGKMIKT